jgi:hypothetical protein
MNIVTHYVDIFSYDFHIILYVSAERALKRDLIFGYYGFTHNIGIGKSVNGVANGG